MDVANEEDDADVLRQMLLEQVMIIYLFYSCLDEQKEGHQHSP